MKKGILVIGAIILSVVLFSYPHFTAPVSGTEEKALTRVEGFLTAVNHNKPALVYQYLTPDIKELIDQDGFVENFAQERSYPYLTPLYLYLEKLELSDDGKTGHVNCVVAARLPGEKMEFAVVFVDDNYYVDTFREIADGSFREKFKKLSGGEGGVPGE